LLVRTMSLMLCWASASAVATRMGPLHAAAHQGDWSGESTPPPLD
jgi:hypothetical protein